MAASKGIPLADDFDADEISPYRRRSKAVPVRSKRFARLRFVLRCLLFAVLVVLPAGYLGVRLAMFALTSQEFALRSAEDVTLEGNHYVSTAEVLNALGVPTSAGAARRSGSVNLFHLSLSRAKKQVEAIPWVHSATLTRAYPHHLTVRVEERTPLAFVTTGGRVKLTDAEGVFLERPEKASFDFPVLSGLEELNAADRKSRLDLYQEFMRQVANPTVSSGWTVSEVGLADADDLQAMMVEGNQTVALHFGSGDFEQRFRNFLALLPELNKSNTKVDSMDLRYRNQIVVNPQATSSAGPASSGASDTRKE